MKLAGYYFLFIIINIGFAEIDLSSNNLLTTINRIDTLYRNGEYKQVVEIIDSVLHNVNPNILNDSMLIRLYALQSFSYVALDKKEQALQSFRYLLMINPKFDLDPKFVSPKIIEVFEESKRKRSDTILLTLPTFPISSSKESFIKKKMMLSLLYPGLGQISQKKKKGYIFLGLESASITGLITTHFLTNSAHYKYLTARTLPEIEETYKNYSFWYKLRFGFIISAITIWGLNYIDITLF
ncbi:MAG: hypothetical protein ABIK19_03045 [candidate division WOR-3 bacterium]